MCWKDRHAAAETVTGPRAFTFVEVMVALAVASVSVLALMRLHLISIRTADMAGVRAQAVLLAEQKIAEKLALGYPSQGTESGTVEEGPLSLRWRTSVEDAKPPELAAAGIGGLREISVEVTWRQGIGPRRVQMTTYVADRKIE